MSKEYRWPYGVHALVARGKALLGVRRRSEFTKNRLHYADLLHQANEIVKELFLNDLTVYPMGDSTEFDVKRFPGGRDHLAISAFHWASHRSGEIRHRARPIAHCDFDLVRMVDELIVWKCLEEFNRLCLMIRTPFGWIGLTRPSHDGVRRVPFFKRIPVLPVP
jgi:hypothetical protein